MASDVQFLRLVGTFDDAAEAGKGVLLEFSEFPLFAMDLSVVDMTVSNGDGTWYVPDGLEEATDRC